jgi:hypothetical protein
MCHISSSMPRNSSKQIKEKTKLLLRQKKKNKKKLPRQLFEHQKRQERCNIFLIGNSKFLKQSEFDRRERVTHMLFSSQVSIYH